MLLVVGFWITFWSADPHVSPNAPGSWSDPSKRNTLAVATWCASFRTSKFGYAFAGTRLFGETIAPVETQMVPAAGLEMYFRKVRISGLSLNAVARSPPPISGLPYLGTIE